jgi:hypothetical protein
MDILIDSISELNTADKTLIGAINEAFMKTKGFGEMFIYENVTATLIDKANSYHAAILGSAGHLEGFTAAGGARGAISAAADYSGTVAGTTKFTSAGHERTTGEVITITGTTNYEGAYFLTRIDNDNYYCTVAYVSSQAGFWRKPCTLKCNVGYAGHYKVEFSLTGDAAANGKNFRFELNQNTDELDNVSGDRTFSTGSDYSFIGGNGIVELAEGDVIWLSGKNTSDDADFTARNYNFNIWR